MENKHLKRRLKHMIEPDKNCETRVEDVAWLCSLSESEIDMLISLKLLINQRAKMIGCKKLANRFNLKMIRAIAVVLMEHLKAEIKESSLIPNTMKSTSIVDACNLLKCSNENDANIDELSRSLGADIQSFLTRGMGGTVKEKCASGVLLIVVDHTEVWKPTERKHASNIHSHGLAQFTKSSNIKTKEAES